MSVDPKNAVAGTVDGGLASRAALFVTFYCPRSGSSKEQLQNRLCETLGLRPREGYYYAPAQSAIGEVILHTFNPPNEPAAHDTTVLQLVLNAPGPATEAWARERHHLETVLDPAFLRYPFDPTNLTGVFGYTLTFQAVLDENINPYPALESLLQHVRRLHETSDEDIDSLAQADVEGGRLWLMAAPPIAPNRLHSATVYVALSPFDKTGRMNEHLTQRVLFGKSASLMMPDLIAHKGYIEMLKYRRYEGAYQEYAKVLQETTGRLLGDLAKRMPETDEMDDLADAYNNFSSMSPEFGRLHRSLLRHLHNYDRWSNHLGNNSVLDWHRNHLESSAAELELVVAEARDTLEAASTAVSMVQVQVDKAHERSQRKGQLLLAVVGASLAVPEIVDRDAAGQILRSLGAAEPGDGYNFWALFGMQIGGILMVALLILLAMWLLDGTVASLLARQSRKYSRTSTGQGRDPAGR